MVILRRFEGLAGLVGGDLPFERSSSISFEYELDGGFDHACVSFSPKSIKFSLAAF